MAARIVRLVGGGLVLVESGYGTNGGMPDSLLLAFSIDGN
jgi:hypothetical protein